MWMVVGLIDRHENIKSDLFTPYSRLTSKWFGLPNKYIKRSE